MHANDVYKTHHRREWSRVDMLLSLLAATIEQIELALQATQHNNRPELMHHRTRATTLLSVLQSGVDEQYGDVAVNTGQLYEFAQHCVLEGDEKLLTSAIGVLTDIKEGFEGIREEAVSLERSGQIPPLPADSTLDATV